MVYPLQKLTLCNPVTKKKPCAEKHNHHQHFTIMVTQEKALCFSWPIYFLFKFLM